MIFGFLDLLVLNSIFFLMKWYAVPDLVLHHGDEYYNLWLTANLGWLSCAIVQRLYDPASANGFERDLGRTSKTYLLFLILTLTYLYFGRQVAISRTFVSVFLIAFPFSLLINRIAYLIVWSHIRSKELLAKRVIILGYNDIAKKLTDYFEKDNRPFHLVGYCEDVAKVNELTHYPILCSLANVYPTSKELQVTDIYSTILPDQDHRIHDLMLMAEQSCIRFKLVPDLRLYADRPMHLNYFSDLAILSARKEPLEDIANRLRKRVFDIVFSSVVILLILTWLIPAVCIVIWLDSGRPFFFVQKRSGRNNKSFNCIKFRSMKRNQLANEVQATRDDLRLTRFGRFLRKTNLDEFPQFFNVLIGDMSIVGPRPHMLKHTSEYSVLISKYMLRQLLKPGITGWAQVNGFRGETRRIEDMEGRVNHDIVYMEKWSLGFDMKIIALTIYNVFKGEKNAY